MTYMPEIDIKKYWFHDSVFASSFFDAQSIIIPDGERFVISSVERAVSNISDEQFGNRIKNLLHEESAHSEVHDAYNQMLQREGYKLGFFAKLGGRIFYFFKKNFPNTINLGISSSIEYFTFIFSKHAFENNLFDGDRIDERLRRLWTWHATEEIEHRGTCFDVFYKFNGSYVKRIISMCIAAPVFFSLAHLNHFSLLWQNRALYKPKIMFGGMRFLFGANGIYAGLLKEWIKFFKPGFHPSQTKVAGKPDKILHHYHIENDLIKYFS